MGSTYLSPAAKRKMPDPNPYSASSNGGAKRSKQPLSPQISFRLLCHSSRVGGVIGKSGAVIKQLQQSTGAKIRIEDAPAEYPDRVITVIAPSIISGRFDVEGSEIDVSKAQDALVRVFERILEVAMESNGAAVGAGVVSCRLLIESSQVGSVIGKGGKIVEKIRKECGCKIRVLNEKLPACAGPTDQVVEIEGDVVAVKRGLLAVSRQLQDSPAVDNPRMGRPVETPPHEILHKPREFVPQEIINRYYGVVPQETLRRPLDIAPEATLRRPLQTVQETLPNHRTDFLSQRNNVPLYVPTSSVSYASGVNHSSLESERFQNVDTKPVPQDVMFKILCGVDRVGGIIGKGGGIIKTLQNETGATITIGNSVSECDDRLITITASENPESQYSPAQKATVLVFSRIIETGFEKGLDAGSSKGSSVTARLVVPSNVVGCLLGKGGTIISEMRKITGTGIHITGGDQAPKCVSDNEQVIQITGEFSKVKDAVYRVTAKLRDNLFSSVPISAGTRNSSSISTEASSYGRSWDPASLRLQPSVGVSHSVSRHSTLTQGMDQRGLAYGLDQRGLSHGLDQRGLSHGLDQRGLSHGFDQRERGISHGLDQHGLDERGVSHGFDQQGLSRGLDQHGLDQHGISHGLDRHGFSYGLDQDGLSHGMEQREQLAHGLDQRGLSRGYDQRGLSHSHGLDQHGLSHGLDQRGPHHGLDQHGLSHDLDQRGIPHDLDRPLSPPRLWESQTVAGVNSRDITDVGRGVSSFKGGFELGSGGKSAIVTNTTVEIKVPESVIGCVYGENGNNLARLRQISGAKVIVHQPRYGSSDRIIVISGTPDETQAAQSLLQAFILTGPS